jgi:hypothetical protein
MPDLSDVRGPPFRSLGRGVTATARRSGRGAEKAVMYADGMDEDGDDI